VDALNKKDFKRRDCWNRLNENRRTLNHLSDLPDSRHVCGKYPAMLPCSFANPAK
jgi:hypothetical protein